MNRIDQLRWELHDLEEEKTRGKILEITENASRKLTEEVKYLLGQSPRDDIAFELLEEDIEGILRDALSDLLLVSKDSVWERRFKERCEKRRLADGTSE